MGLILAKYQYRKKQLTIKQIQTKIRVINKWCEKKLKEKEKEKEV